MKNHTMQACVYNQYGGPDVVMVDQLPIPVPGDNELLVKVHYSTVNRTDCGFRSAEYFVSRFWSGLFRPKYKILGCEYAGEVISKGAKVTNVEIGDRICGFNDERFGGHAEYNLVKDTDAFAKIPESISFQTAAALTEGGHYALCQIRAAKLKPNANVMVYGATGAIGSAATQLLMHYEMKVTAVGPTEKMNLVKSLHPTNILDYKQSSLDTLQEPHDLILDAVGKLDYHKIKSLLSPNGKYISTELGKNGKNVWMAMLTSMSKGKRVLFPIPLTLKSDITLLCELAASKQFVPMIDRTFELSDIKEAYRYVETGQKNGNVLLKVAKDL
jgi:NADPH:quinone reductase-like Zn-dependent oxidoreductase